MNSLCIQYEFIMYSVLIQYVFTMRAAGSSRGRRLILAISDTKTHFLTLNKTKKQLNK